MRIYKDDNELILISSQIAKLSRKCAPSIQALAEELLNSIKSNKFANATKIVKQLAKTNLKVPVETGVLAKGLANRLKEFANNSESKEALYDKYFYDKASALEIRSAALKASDEAFKALNVLETALKNDTDVDEFDLNHLQSISENVFSTLNDFWKLFKKFKDSVNKLSRKYKNKGFFLDINNTVEYEPDRVRKLLNIETLKKSLEEAVICLKNCAAIMPLENIIKGLKAIKIPTLDKVAFEDYLDTLFEELDSIDSEFDSYGGVHSEAESSDNDKDSKDSDDIYTAREQLRRDIVQLNSALSRVSGIMDSEATRKNLKMPQTVKFVLKQMKSYKVNSGGDDGSAYFKIRAVLQPELGSLQSYRRFEKLLPKALQIKKDFEELRKLTKPQSRSLF